MNISTPDTPFGKINSMNPDLDCPLGKINSMNPNLDTPIGKINLMNPDLDFPIYNLQSVNLQFPYLGIIFFGIFLRSMIRKVVPCSRVELWTKILP